MRIGSRQLVGAVVVVVAACSSGGGGRVDEGLGQGTATTVAADEATFFLTVSNQSFQRPSVHIAVEIDGERVVAQLFEVGGQHNFVGFALALAPGEHTIEATAAGEHLAVESFELEAGDPDYGTVFFWADEETDPFVDLQILEEPPGFG